MANKIKTRKIQLKPLSVTQPSKSGYFHGFFTQAYSDGDYASSKPIAVIEFENGDVKLVHPEEIRFTAPPEA
jgi:hypothetical protein